ncbi:caspase family protein [Tautonia plasticadhaerens]|uniref:Caspase domain protein n=1 Tax=Tautonia plasticadhaerens TaxID=2527974 RepID=A0A518H9D5_9BACT|nr:caspase family protein [Tautonia plasticadhaerens]QDV37459.1 Caspase domain protein [Tautonia plasticadhaerens]
MTATPAGADRLRALIVGSGFYFPNQLPDGSSFRSLLGAAADAERVAAFVRDRLVVPADRLVVLSATATGVPDQAAPPEPSERWPTYENLVGAFTALTAAVELGDPVLIYYSGHGGRARTAYPELKEADGIDESLVPCNIGDPAARYLRDVELACLLARLVERGADLTVILDSCHSGGATRSMAPGVMVRGLARIDEGPRPTASLVGTREQLGATWRRLATPGRRAIGVETGGWLPDAAAPILLAACREVEEAKETAFDGYGHGGVLTFWLLDTLRRLDPGLTYGRLRDRLVAKVHTQFENQTPVLVGEADRPVFGGLPSLEEPAILVLKSDLANRRLLVEAGQAQELTRGTQLAIYPPGAPSIRDPEGRLGLAELAEPGASESWASLTETFGDRPIEDGALAVVIAPGPRALRRKVRLVGEGPWLAQVATALHAGGRGFVERAAEAEPAEFQVTGAGGRFTILASDGTPVPNQGPPLPTGTAEAAELVARLVHLARFRVVYQIDNPDLRSPLANKVVATVEPDGSTPGAPPSSSPVPLRVGDRFHLTIRNQSTRTLSLAVLNLQPNWRVVKLLPRDEDAFAIESGRSRSWTLVASSLPEGCHEAIDFLKVFATLRPTRFRWLELPPLGSPDRPGSRNIPHNPLEELFAALGADQLATRALLPSLSPGRDWTTATVELRLRRDAGGTA